MLRQLIRRLGTVRATLLVTVVSIFCSVLISVVIALACHRVSDLTYSMLVSSGIPILLAPPLAYVILDLLVRLDKAESDLKKAMSEIKTLSGLIPICAACKKVRDDQGYWQQVEVYIRERSGVEFTHGICPDCARKLYPDFLLDE